ncbi:MAG TPA: SDR family NAD(P)-dependent oxidoreductase [Kofleriaceae bacterium]|nr:SDR family NAD(P)-dependent oxidoreductase [Kofleriaceae bacterium]
MLSLRHVVAVITGSSRGAGRGIALALGDAGATVYVTGRTSRAGMRPVDGAPGTIEDVAAEVTARGGQGIPVQVDLTDPAQVWGLFERVARVHGRVDVLANAVWGGNEVVELEGWGRPFWQQALEEEWRRTMEAGVYAYLLASREAARRMVDQRGGLIVHLTDGLTADGSRPYGGQIFWDLAHLCVDRMAVAMAHELRDYRVAVLALMPGFVRTERVLMHMVSEEVKRAFRFDLSETPEYVGRAVAALAADPHVMRRTGTVAFVADLALEYGFTDVDGRVIPRFDPSR